MSDTGPTNDRIEPWGDEVDIIDQQIPVSDDAPPDTEDAPSSAAAELGAALPHDIEAPIEDAWEQAQPVLDVEYER